MSRALTQEELRERQLRRDEKNREKNLNPELDERCIEILKILRDAPNHPEVKYNSKYFEDYFDTANITILRAVKKLKDQKLIEDKQLHGNYVLKDGADVVYSAETKRKIAIVSSLSGLLQQYKNTPLANSVEKLIGFIEPNIVKDDVLFSTGRVIASPQMEYDINIRNWDRVYEAMQYNFKIKFRYTKPYTNNRAIRVVCPYQLILDNGSVYLSAYSEYAEMVLLYDLNFMTEVVMTRESFELPDDYDFKNFCAGGRLGAFKSDDITTFKIKFTGYAKDWIKYHKWSQDQKILKETEDSTTITFTSAQEEKVFEEIMKWGTQAQPLAPKSLVKRWKEEIKTLYEMINQ